MSPFGLLSVLYVPKYWHPVRAFNLTIGLEDFLNAFVMGGLSWQLGTFPVRRRLQLHNEPGQFLKRLVSLGALGVTFHVASLLIEIGPLSANLAGMFVVILVLTYLRPDLWQIPCAGAIGYGVVHFLVLHWMFTICPEFADQWNSANLWGPTVRNVPLDEIAFALALGACWPFIMAYSWNAKLDRSYSETELNGHHPNE
jgi:hypothetical protein